MDKRTIRKAAAVLVVNIIVVVDHDARPSRTITAAATTI